ncbi:uncharacterized protein BDR25DRAFT_295894 [Lindgomyces ingoldianus]|uniref:Uncharacterized protein n=1 Tax=Lindgomyces ingoldianus TaxID=673940 RepID=A0ACB6QDM4_9PLEO|nr:uncharacterized protein BDR25DRAFT_295894 [Lindgomyces ingoldianus]KAF2465073.1 hypothetical protein BDR25DRAFT_295894 [Lindgomyces ingoldianus]
MSGVEIAGLVLGAIPLVIAALKQYEDGLDSAMAFFKWNRELSVLIQALWYQHTSYVQSIKLLLSPITTDEERQTMLEDSKNQLWKSKSMSDALSDRLGDAYQAYMQTVSTIEEIVKSLAEKLDIQGSDEISQQGLEAIVLANPLSSQENGYTFHFKRRVNFTMSRKKVRRLLEELKSCNLRLDSFANKAEKLKEPYRTETRLKFAAPLGVIENNATKLYNILCRTWCASHDSHRAGLLLERRLVENENHGVGGRVQLSGREDAKPVVKIIAPSPAPSLSITQSPYEDLSRLQVVTDICATIQAPSHPWIGFCLDSDGYLRGAYPTESRSPVHTQNEVTLQDLFQEQHIISKLDQYNLSVTLSSSLLQLSQTPWLCRNWSKTDIVFLRTVDASGLSVSIRHPYLKKEHRWGDQEWTERDAHSMNDCSKLLGLGVLLVEITSGRSIESMRLREDLGPNGYANEVTDLQVARRWLLEQKNSGNLTLGFESAISHCLKSYVDPTSRLRSEDFRGTVKNEVLAPLRREMSLLFRRV